MLFCPPGTDVVELADLSFPNPNFYAMSAALGHRYWLLPARASGHERPIDRDLEVDVDTVAALLPRLADATGTA